MSLLQALFTVTFLFAMAVGLLIPNPMEGRWFLQAYHNPKSSLLYTTCHSIVIAQRSERLLDVQYRVTLNSGVNMFQNYIGVLTVPQPKRGPIDVFTLELTGELSHFCRAIDMTFSGSGNTFKIISDCLFDAVCITKSKIPTLGEMLEVEELCPGYTKIDNSHC